MADEIKSLDELKDELNSVVAEKGKDSDEAKSIQEKIDELVEEGSKTYDEKFVRELKKEAKDRRLKLRDVEAELKKLKDEKLSDSEKKDLRINELEKQVEALTEEGKIIKLDSSILGIASTKGFKYLDVVLLLAKKELASEEEADEKTIEKIVERIAKEKPELLSGGEIVTVGAGNREKRDLEESKDPDVMFGEMIRVKRK
ncbi:hypothetical protein FJY90_03480 [Candidatus Gottesmanbacteria bacterium]|nr:hypothetical protein [Candidatus Gottesmanbacteria bacterium]